MGRRIIAFLWSPVIAELVNLLLDGLVTDAAASESHKHVMVNESKTEIK